MNRKLPGFTKSIAFVDLISIFNALFLIQRIQRMIQSSVPIRDSILSRARGVFTDIFYGLEGKYVLFRNLLGSYNTITVPEKDVPKTSNYLGLVDFRCSDACRLGEWCFSFLRETVGLKLTLNAKNQIMLIITSGLVTIFPGSAHWNSMIYGLNVQLNAL
jgi:hypothetical protein